MKAKVLVVFCIGVWFVSIEHCRDFGCNFWRMGAKNEGLTPENLKHIILQH